MGSTSINSAINNHIPFYSSVNSYSGDNLNENSNYTNSPQNGQNASPTSNEDSLITNSDLATYKPIFNYELAFTNYTKPSSCSPSKFKETNETKFETYSNLIDNEISIAPSTKPDSPAAIVDNSIQNDNTNGGALIGTVQIENQSHNDNADGQSSMASEKSVNGHSFISKEKVELQQPSGLSTIQEESNEKESSLYSIDSIDLTVEEETDIIVDPSIFKPKVKDSLDQSPDQESKSSDSDSGSPSKKVTKKRKKARKNYFAPPKKAKPKTKKVEEEEENMLSIALTDELDLITKENTEKNIISLREKNYVTVVKKASEKPNEELDNNTCGEDSGDGSDSDCDDDAPRQRSKKSRKITWNTTPQYKEFHKNQSITLGERFCSPVKSKTEKPKKSCISRKAPFNSPNTKKPKKSRPLSPVTVTRIIYSKK